MDLGDTMAQNTGQGRIEQFGNNQSIRENMIKLPKIEMKHFDGQPMNWIAFWDLFERNIDKNITLSDVNKMQYLKRLLRGPAENVIAHLLITEDNYEPAALKKRYGHPGLLRNSHLAAIKAVDAVYNSIDLFKLRKFHEDVEGHYKALTVVGVNCDSYFMAVMPDLMKKLPREIVLSIKRMKDVRHDWKLGEFLDALWEELQFRGSSEQMLSSNKEGIKEPIKGRALAVSTRSCAY